MGLRTRQREGSIKVYEASMVVAPALAGSTQRIVVHPPAEARPSRDPSAKRRHLEVCLREPVEYRKRTGLECFDLRNMALPEVSLRDIDLSVRFAGRKLSSPLMIGPMTGGTPEGLEINRLLAATAQRYGLAMSVGSQRIAIEKPELARYYQVRDVAPDILLYANLGAGQLVRGWGIREALTAVRMIGADALFVHLNPVQEAIQAGDRDFRGLAQRLSELCRQMSVEGVPVFAREVCFGLSEQAARRLADCGVDGIDCAGAGGTSWAKVEAYCATDPRRRALGLRFGEWGIPTAKSIGNVRRVAPGIPLVASGGLRSGIDLAKALALGADVGAMARPFLLKASEGEAALHAFVEEVIEDLRVCMFATGAPCVAALRGCLDPAGQPVSGAES